MAQYIGGGGAASADSVDSDAIIDGEVNTADIADDAVTTDKIADDAVTIDKLADNSVGVDQIVPGAISSGNITNNSIQFEDINQITQGRFVGRKTGSDGDLETMTPAEARSELNVEDGAEVNPDVVGQAEAEAGTATTERIWTAQRVAQAIAALGGGGGGSGIIRLEGAWHGVYPSVNTVHGSSLSPVNNNPYFIPIIPNSADFTVGDLAILIATAASTGTIRFGLYNATAAGLPGTRIVDAGTVAFTSTGALSVSLGTPQALSAGTLYYLGFNTNFTGSPYIRTFNRAQQVVPSIIGASTFDGNGATYYKQDATETGDALPATAGAVTAQQLDPPKVGMYLDA